MSNTQERTTRRLMGYDLLMRNTELSSYEIPEDFMCDGCINHRPDWEYRYCLYTECPHIKGQRTFRERYFEETSNKKGADSYETEK